MYGAFDISASGLVAQRTRMTVIAQNTANRQTILNENNEYDPYRRKMTIFASGTADDPNAPGVRVAEILDDPAPLQPKYQPGSPFADDSGYVYYPNVNGVIETMDAMEAQRAYDANIAVIEGTKAVLESALRIIA